MTDERSSRIVVVRGIKCEAYFLPNGVECIWGTDVGILIDETFFWDSDEWTGHVPLSIALEHEGIAEVESECELNPENFSECAESVSENFSEDAENRERETHD